MPASLSFVDLQPGQWGAIGGILFAVGQLRKWDAVRAIGIGAAITGLASWGMEYETPTLQVAMFLGCSYLAWCSTKRRDLTPGAANRAGRRRVGLGLIGRNVEVFAAIKDGRGKVMVDLHEWDVTGPDAPVGATVKIMAQQDAVLKVMPVKASSHPEKTKVE